MERLPRKNQRALWAGEKDDTRASASVSGTVRVQRHLPAPGQSLWSEGQLRLETSHVIPAIIRKCVEAKENGQRKIVLWGDGSPGQSKGPYMVGRSK